MAKQTFTTGQVLTAAQMTSLQQTAMGGGAATAKTANYVLVAADAGTTVAMNAAGSTTITVNTGLFAAGDTVFIQNLGAGACTVTAGTATVATAGSLILPQNDAGILYFTATGAAIFYDYIQAGAVSPLTTKGDLYTFSTSDARLGVGANGTTLVADSSESVGMKWATPSSGGMTLISTTTLSSTSVTLSSIPGTYKDLRLYIKNYKPSADGWSISLSINGAPASNTYIASIISNSTVNTGTTTAFGNSAISLHYSQDDTTATGLSVIHIPDYANSTTWKMVQVETLGNDDATPTSANFYRSFGLTNITNAITELRIAIAGGTFTSGSVLLYGVS